MVYKLFSTVLLFLTVTALQAKEKAPIKIQHEFQINSSIDKAWKVLGPGFENAYKWAASVNHSEARDSISFHGSSCTERGCNVSGIGNIKEKLLQYSDKEHTISYQIYEGMPSMVKYASNTWQLIDNGNNTCKLIMTVEMKTGGFMGAMMKGMMKNKMKKLSKNTGEEFVYYVENNEMPHPRKVNAQNKYTKKNNSK